MMNIDPHQDRLTLMGTKFSNQFLRFLKRNINTINSTLPDK